MDFRLGSLSFITFASLLTGCSEPNKYEAVMPNRTETCGGRAIQSQYIVHRKSGTWDFVENHDRENFKLDYVVPNFDDIDFIEYDQRILISDQPGKSLEAQLRPTALTGVDNWGAAAINAEVAWRANALGDGVIVAVVDTGVDISHSQLSTQIAYNEGESGSKKNNGVDDDGNGFVDDYAGYNFLANSGDVIDDVSHGTHVSGIIAAQHSDTSIRTGYVQGVAPSAKILPIKFLGEDGGSLSGALKGIDYAIKRGARVINASWGGTGCSTSLRQKVGEAAESHVLFVAAAGNSGANLDRAPEYPAAFNLPLQITVGSITPSLNMSNFSNYSETLVHIFAPGSSIVSTVPGNQYAAMSGTSMATPFVAAAAAVLMSHDPDLSLAEIRRRLFDTVVHGDRLQGVTSGRLSLGSAF